MEFLRRVWQWKFSHPLSFSSSQHLTLSLWNTRNLSISKLDVVENEHAFDESRGFKKILISSWPIINVASSIRITNPRRDTNFRRVSSKSQYRHKQISRLFIPVYNDQPIWTFMPTAHKRVRLIYVYYNHIRQHTVFSDDHQKTIKVSQIVPEQRVKIRPWTKVANTWKGKGSEIKAY